MVSFARSPTLNETVNSFERGTPRQLLLVKYQPEQPTTHTHQIRGDTLLADVDKAIEDIDYRAANARAGYVYVISNLGAFGERMVKIGMTRPLDPMDRIRELSDASVPFNFDIHALFFSDDAVTIESEMHQRLANKRVNRVNLRREFFYTTPAEAREHLKALTGELLSFEETPEAIEFHQSMHAAGGRPATTK